MSRWHQFNSVAGSPEFGRGPVEQARKHLAALNRARAVNHYALTTLDEGEVRPERHRRGARQSG